jgi:hypothetical protein
MRPPLSRALRGAVAVAALCACAVAGAEPAAPGTSSAAPADRRMEAASGVRIDPDARVTPVQRERLQHHADLGIDALRRYLEITRGIYNWRLKDVLNPS